MNYVDYIIIGLLILALLRGYSRGAIVIILDLIGFAISIGLTIVLAPYLELPIRRFVQLSDQLIRAIGFLVGYLIIQAVWSVVSWFILQLFRAFEESILNRFVGIVISFLYTAILIGIVLLLALNIPLDKKYREQLDRSKLAPRFLTLVSPLRPSVEQALKNAISEVTKFITIRPESGERLNLRLAPSRLEINPAGEQEIFNLVNKERTARGLKALQFDDRLRDVARAHAQDMWERKYFAHVNPDGQDPFDRLQAAKISFVAAGENLALAPNIELAHTGLMNSPGHRANILQEAFGKVGIGVISGPPYGEMVVQEFTD